MKKIFTLFFILLCTSSYANTAHFRPYIGFDGGLSIADYTTDIAQEENYYSATINAGARIGRNFGFELFFTHSSSNDAEYIYSLETLNHEIYYMGFGFDIYAYYGISPEFDFFTSFGVANYKIYNKYEYITPYLSETQTQSDNSVNTRLGIGFMYTLPSDNLSLLLQYQYAPISNEIINTLSEFSVGVRYIF